jgi:hypothetical protein
VAEAESTVQTDLIILSLLQSAEKVILRTNLPLWQRGNKGGFKTLSISLYERERL